MPDQPIHVVYHSAALGPEWGWKGVVAEQFALLREVGLPRVRATHVGPGGDWVRAEAGRAGLDLTVVRADPNTDHYETFAIAEVERLAKAEGTDRPILYLHSKGVSAPHHLGKLRWRKLMEFHTVRRWRENVGRLADHDCVGVGWIDDGGGHSCGHFCGNFWIARPDWVRRLPDFWRYHDARDRVRFSCEQWIGGTPGCRPWSLACRNATLWHDDFDWSALAPWDFRCEVAAPSAPVRLNLGGGALYREGWVNVDPDPAARADLREDAAELPSVVRGSVDEIYAGHVAEHVADIGVTLGRWREILKPGGRLTVAVPGLEGANRLRAEGQTFPGADRSAGEGGLTGDWGRDGTAGDPGRRDPRRRVFDRSSLALCLAAAGFADIRPANDHPLAAHRCSELGWPIALEAAKPGGG